MLYRLFLSFVLLLIASCLGEKKCIENEELLKEYLDQSLIGKVTTSDIKRKLQCGYALDFDSHGNQLWKVNLQEKRKIKFYFNEEQLLIKIEDANSKLWKKEILADDNIYYIPLNINNVQITLAKSREGIFSVCDRRVIFYNGPALS